MYECSYMYFFFPFLFENKCTHVHSFLIPERCPCTFWEYLLFSQCDTSTFTHNNHKQHPKGPNNTFWCFIWASGMYYYYYLMSSNVFSFFVFNWLPHPGTPTFTHNDTRRAQKMHQNTLFGPKVCILSYNFLWLSMTFLIFVALYILCRLTLILGSLFL